MMFPNRREMRWRILKLGFTVLLKFALLVGAIAAGVYFASLGFLP